MRLVIFSLEAVHPFVVADLAVGNFEVFRSLSLIGPHSHADFCFDFERSFRLGRYESV